MLENLNYLSSNAAQPPIAKFLNNSVTISNLRDVTEGNTMSGIRTAANANWPVYRLSDIMLIKAEAIARRDLTAKANANDGKDGVNEGFKLVNAIFSRSNPGLRGSDVATSTNDEYYSSRLDDNYAVADPQKPKPSS